MKNLLFGSILLLCCTGCTTAPTTSNDVVTDSTAVDSTKIDSLKVDTTVLVKDTIK